MQAADGFGTTVTLRRTPCINPAALVSLPRLNDALVMAGFPTITAGGMHAASLVYEGATREGCWVLAGEKVGVVIDMPGGVQMMPVPATDFRKVEGF